MLSLLDEIADRLAGDPLALGLIGVGSTGRHRHRRDEHSDLDFFVIAEEKEHFLSDLSWLGPVLWSHRDTRDGAKALVGDTFCEFAVFLPEEMTDVKVEGAQVLWARADPPEARDNTPATPDESWLVNEILSNLYVGLHRWLRGERLSAMRFVQGQALDNLLILMGADDPFAPSRRAERLPLRFAEFAPGYDHTPTAARAILDALPHGGGAMRTVVEELLHRAR